MSGSWIKAFLYRKQVAFPRKWTRTAAACPTLAPDALLLLRLAFFSPPAARTAPWRRETGAAVAPRWLPAPRMSPPIFTALREPQWRLMSTKLLLVTHTACDPRLVKERKKNQAVRLFAQTDPT